MKILKLKLFQESACYKKPFAFKVAETYPLPPYSTVIGMFHKILQAKSGEYFPMDISIQGEYESIYNNFQTLRSYKNQVVTTMPRNVHQLLNVNLIIHIRAEDDVIDKIYYNIINGVESFTLGRNEDIVRIDEIKYIDEPKDFEEEYLIERNAYIPKKYLSDDTMGITYRLNKNYIIDNGIRKWEKVDVKYVECSNIKSALNVKVDCDNDPMYFG